jgi:cytochrome c5
VRTSRAWAAVLIAGLAAAAIWSARGAAKSPPSGPARREVYATEFPDGEGKPLADRFCLMCHTATLVTQQAKDSTGWEKSLVQMEKWGIQPTPAEHDTLRRYLLSHYGPRARRP